MSTVLKSRKLAALAALVSLLFSQMALGWYQCPGTALAKFEQAAVAHHDATMAGCDGMDLEQPNLCQAHAQTGNQSLDRAQAPDVPAYAPGPSIAIEPVAPLVLHSTLRVTETRLLTRSTAPPIAIRNCCFRI